MARGAGAAAVTGAAPAASARPQSQGRPKNRVRPPLPSPALLGGSDLGELLMVAPERLLRRGVLLRPWLRDFIQGQGVVGGQQLVPADLGEK